MGNNFFWIIGVFVVLWLVWVGTGGPAGGNTDRPFIKPLPPVDTGEIYGPPELIPSGEIIRRHTTTDEKSIKEEAEKETSKDVSLFGGKVSFTVRGRTGARPSDTQKEYLEIIASPKNLEPIAITDWTIKSAVTGRLGKIGNGSYLPYAGRVNTEQTIFLQPGEHAYVVTGHSPIGVSFRINTCTGYFEQFQDFTPSLPKQCPYPEDEELPPPPNGLKDHCIEFIEDLPQCSAYTKALPLEFANDPTCQEYVGTQITYNGCVETHREEKDFYKKEWRVYLKRDNELWKEKRETILLLDSTGKLVDTLSY